MRSESCKQETESESNYSDWEQASVALVNSDHNILATPNTTLLEVYFTFYSASNRGWLCHLCSKCNEGDEYWRSVGIKLHEHPKDTFKRHMESKKHTNTKKKKQEIKNLLSKGNIYQQMIEGERQKLQTCKEGGAYLRISFWHLLVNLKNK